MNEKQIDKIIDDLKKLTKGTMPIIQVFDSEEDKALMLKRLKGKRGVRNIEVRTRAEINR